MKKTYFFLIITLSLVCSLLYTNDSFSIVEADKGTIYIVDRTGERWDITQAVSIGFDPEGFQFGIGRNAFTTLDDTSLSENNTDVHSSLRVLGIADSADAKAYSIPKLRGHEIANSMVGSTPIAAAY